jgi:archaemetzincin
MDLLPDTHSATIKKALVIFSIILITATIISSQNSIPGRPEIRITPLDGTVPPSDTTGIFLPLPPPEPGDWLAEHKEDGQTYEQFLAGPRNKVEGNRTTIYLQPIWAFEKENGPPLDYLKRFAEIYFSLPVKMKRTIYPPEKKFSMRINPYSHNLQANADKLLRYLMERVPVRAYCILGITMTDLYPDPMWNFVFGYATYQERVGIFSFARYAPTFYDVSNSSNPKLVFLRSCKILAHETGHMFGLAHCISYRCVMNGCNSLEENDSQPIHLCPECLKKLQHAIKFDKEKRYRELAAFYRASGLTHEAQWVENRMKSFTP